VNVCPINLTILVKEKLIENILNIRINLRGDKCLSVERS
jgi:hypothetical protein